MLSPTMKILLRSIIYTELKHEWICDRCSGALNFVNAYGQELYIVTIKLVIRSKKDISFGKRLNEYTQ